MRRSAPLFVLAALGCAEAAPPADAGTVGEAARPNFEVRLDSESSELERFQVVEDDDGVRIQTGPAGIAYRPDDEVTSGDFRIEAAFALYGAPIGYREAFGVFVGGRELERPDLEYTYLLVRTTGDYLIKRRLGDVTETLVDWTPHEAVALVAAEGDEPLNTLAVEVVGDETLFLVNGVAVHALPTSRARPHGVAGVRVNHRLDVRVDGWVMESLETEP